MCNHAHIQQTRKPAFMLWPQQSAILLIHGYRLLLSPWISQSCRFYPSCSVYTETAIQRFGIMRGLWLGLKRILRCHPWHPGGEDPVPTTSCVPPCPE